MVKIDFYEDFNGYSSENLVLGGVSVPKNSLKVKSKSSELLVALEQKLW